MVVTEFYNFAEWFPGAVAYFFMLAGLLALAALVLGYLIAAFRYGPLVAGDMAFKVTTMAVADLAYTSPRRVWALARLAIQESLRRHVLVALGVFVVILLFAGWFLDNTTNDPSTLYLSFVLTFTTYLTWALAVFISAFSLPTDFKTHTIYTVVTKPVRPGEIVLGRILGFTLMGTALLAVMGLASYVFAIRLLNHTHEVEVATIRPVGDEAGDDSVGRTSLVQGHRHEVVIDADGKAKTEAQHGHWHDVTVKEVDGKKTYELSGPQGMFLARKPHYGSLRFKDSKGQGKERGISVGQEWKYRSYVEGALGSAAVWTFQGITPENYPEGLPIEMTLRVFRSHKGDPSRPISGSLMIKNPKTGRSSGEITFDAKDAIIDSKLIKDELTDSNGNPISLFKDLAPEGEVEIWVRCLMPGQYFGMATPDMYLRSADGSFTLNFIKGFFGIWLQMLLVISFCVMFSTFVSGPVAMLATIAILVVGLFRDDIISLADGVTKGGGPIESLIRIVNQKNMTIEMDEGLTRTIVQSVDNVLLFLMKGIAGLLPDLSKFDESFINHVAKGFDIPFDTLAVWGFRGLAYLCVVFVVGYFFLKTREVAK